MKAFSLVASALTLSCSLAFAEPKDGCDNLMKFATAMTKNRDHGVTKKAQIKKLDDANTPPAPAEATRILLNIIDVVWARPDKSPAQVLQAVGFGACAGG